MMMMMMMMMMGQFFEGRLVAQHHEPTGEDWR